MAINLIYALPESTRDVMHCNRLQLLPGRLQLRQRALALPDPGRQATCQRARGREDRVVADAVLQQHDCRGC